MNIPTINVNLAKCSMACLKYSSHGHFRGCAAFPILIRCPIPRTVTLMVGLGECIDEGREQGSAIPRKRATVFAVLPWRGDNMYRLADAVAVYKRRRAAETFADKDTTGTLVVRELNEGGP